MTAMRLIVRIALVLIFTSFWAAAQEPAAKSPFDPIKFLVGHWQGTSQGEPGEGRGERTYEFVLNGKFLRGSNKTVYPPQKQNPKGETHEDIGFFSYDRQQKRLVLRQFHVEGFVNEYLQQGGSANGDQTIVFETAHIENIPEGWRARESYKVLGPDEFIEVFELAEPGKDFTTYSQGRWKRVK